MAVSDITGLSLVTAALKKCGAIAAGVTVQQTDLNDALFDLNAMLGQWQRRRWLVYRLADVACASTGQPSYTVGPGGSIALDQRPDQIEGAYARLLRGGPLSAVGEFVPGDFVPGDFTGGQLGYGNGAQPLDYPLSVLGSREDYASIGMKGLSTWPACCFYDPAFPVGNLFVWPIPISDIWEIHILVKQTLEQVTLDPAPGGNLGLPAEYQEALLYNLVMRLRPSYGLDPDPVVSMLAAAGLNTIRAANSAIPRISPNVPTGRRGRVYWPGLESSNAVTGGAAWGGFVWGGGNWG